MDEGCLDRGLADADCEIGNHVQRIHSRSATRRSGRNPTGSDPRGAQLKWFWELEKVAGAGLGSKQAAAGGGGRSW